MDFDPLSLFSAPEPSPGIELVLPTGNFSETRNFSEPGNFSGHQDKTNPHENDDQDAHLAPFHILDLPLLQLNPPEPVILFFLRLLAPAAVQNFDFDFKAPAEKLAELAELAEKLAEQLASEVFAEKGISLHQVDEVLPWLALYCPRFSTVRQLAALPQLAPTFKRNHEVEYNAWLTRIISSPRTSEETQLLASTRLAQNCGRTAQPEFVRNIVIDGLEEACGRTLIALKEPSLTSDNLGLKTWGSALVLGTRFVHHHTSLLKLPVLELGSGTGLAGIVCADLGYQTTLTDLREIVPNLLENVTINKVDAVVDELDWTQPSEFVSKHGSANYATVILSDPIYLPHHPYWVVDMARMFLERTADSRLLVQVPLRPKYEAERALLWSLLEDEFEMNEEHVEDGADDFGEMKFLFRKFQWRSTIDSR